MPTPLQIPVASTPVQEVNGTFRTAWRNFLLAIANKLVGAAAVATVSSPTTVTSTDTTTSTNAGVMTGAYVQADVQRIATLADELKVDHNALVATVNTLVTLANEEKTRFNALLTALNQ